jgi:hypothetical protein
MPLIRLQADRGGISQAEVIRRTIDVLLSDIEPSALEVIRRSGIADPAVVLDINEDVGPRFKVGSTAAVLKGMREDGFWTEDALAVLTTSELGGVPVLIMGCFGHGVARIGRRDRVAA